MINIRKNKDSRFIFTNGCFDCLHLGHFKFLEFCKNYDNNLDNNCLIVGLNSDDSVRRLKGEDRPFYQYASRRFMLESLIYVDQVLMLDDVSVIPLLKEIRPHVLIKGGTTDEIEGREFVESYGGEVVKFENIIKVGGQTISTTNTLGKSK